VDSVQTGWLASDAASAHVAVYWEPGRWLMSLGYFGSLHACAVQVRALERQLEKVTHTRLTGMQQVNLDDDFAHRGTMRAWRRQPETSAVLRLVVPPAVSGEACRTILAWAQRAGVEPRINCLPLHGMIMAGGALSATQAQELDRVVRQVIASVGGARTWVRRPGGGAALEPFFPIPPERPILLRLKQACDPRGILNPGRLLPIDGTEVAAP
jgi:FAD/FMN-containing dehydrogenase